MNCKCTIQEAKIKVSRHSHVAMRILNLYNKGEQKKVNLTIFRRKAKTNYTSFLFTLNERFTWLGVFEFICFFLIFLTEPLNHAIG